MSGAVFDGFFRRQTIDGKTTQVLRLWSCSVGQPLSITQGRGPHTFSIFLQSACSVFSSFTGGVVSDISSGALA